MQTSILIVELLIVKRTSKQCCTISNTKCDYTTMQNKGINSLYSMCLNQVSQTKIFVKI